MRNLTISTEQHRDHRGMPLWHGTCTTGAVSGFGVLGAAVCDRQIGGASYALKTKATPGAPAWRPPTS